MNMPVIHPQMQAVLEHSAALMPAYSISETPLPLVRKKYAQERTYWNSGGPNISTILETKVKGASASIPIRIYHPNPENRLPLLVYLHGGGFVVGSNDSHDRIMRELAGRSGCAVLGIEYSLSPEYKFPVALDEILLVLKWLKDDVHKLKEPAFNIDPERIVLGGDSAGASLSMGVALSFKENLSGLLLIYGWFGLRDSCSARLFGCQDVGMSEEDLTFYQDSYLDSPEDLTDLRLDVLKANLSGIPPVCLIAADMDPLRDDSTTLAALLEQAGVSSELHLHKGVLHGFLHYSRMLDVAVTALDQGADFLRKVLNL